MAIDLKMWAKKSAASNAAPDAPASPPKSKGVTDDRYPSVNFPAQAWVPGRDCEDDVYPVTSRVRTLGDPLPPNLKSPLMRLCDLVESGQQIRYKAADSYVLKFGESETALREGIRMAVDAVETRGVEGGELMKAAAESKYIEKIRSALTAAVSADLADQASTMGAAAGKAALDLAKAIAIAKADRAVPSLGKNYTADDRARIDAVREDLQRMPFQDLEKAYDALVEAGNEGKQEVFELAAGPLLRDFIAKPAYQRMNDRSVANRVELRQGWQDKDLSAAHRILRRFSEVAEARRPEDVELAEDLLGELKPAFCQVFATGVGSLKPAQFNALVDGGKPMPAWSAVVPGGVWATQGLPATPPQGWTRLEPGRSDLHLSRAREAAASGAAMQDRFSGRLAPR
jgi:hypothetical protein